MNRLTSVIGPAPSELPFEDFLAKLKTERERVGRGFIALRNAPKTRKAAARKATRAKKSKPKTLKALAQKHGMSLDDLMLKLKAEGIDLDA